jgi:hypothetical protein
MIQPRISLFVTSEMNMSINNLLSIPGMTCPLGGGFMNDPVLLVANGISYERHNIQIHLDANGTEPGTTRILDGEERRLIPNPNLRDMIDRIVALLQARVRPEQ